MRALPKTLTYAALVAGAALFLLPLLWMLSTALKPLEQTTAVPPDWLPRRFYVGEGSARREVRLAAAVTAPSVWALPEGAPSPVALPRGDVHGGLWTPEGGRAMPVQVLAAVPASPDAPWR